MGLPMVIATTKPPEGGLCDGNKNRPEAAIINCLIALNFHGQAVTDDLSKIHSITNVILNSHSFS